MRSMQVTPKKKIYLTINYIIQKMPPSRSFQLYSIISHISKDNLPNILSTIFEQQIQSQLWSLVEKI